MVKQSKSINAGKRAAAILPSTCLCALLVFGNAVSAFGNVPTRRKARAKSAAVQTKEKPVSTKDGEPFVVETAQQSSTQTPAQRDATRPPGTQQQQTVPPGARPNSRAALAGVSGTARDGPRGSTGRRSRATAGAGWSCRAAWAGASCRRPRAPGS